LKKFITLIILFGIFSHHTFSQEKNDEKLNLMPWPKEIKANKEKFLITPAFSISINSDDNQKAHYGATKFLRRLSGRTGVFIDKGFPLKNDRTATVQITFDKVSEVKLGVDESYHLTIRQHRITIQAKTDIGAIRALETLLQLTTSNSIQYYFPGVTISDAPRFLWRGLMIDVARHFQPVAVIKRNLEAMASVKLNVFHWHLTDDQGFRVESKIYPKLQELASDGLYYTQNQIKDVVQYANRLGIRVIPEFDVPGHASAILTAYPELGSKDNYNYSIERNAGVFDPTLDPTKDITYQFLENLFTEITPLFPDEHFHIGGDENAGKHWTESKHITAFKKKHQLKTNHDLQTYFNIKLEKILLKSGKKLMGWDEIMTLTMPTTAVIHSWRGPQEGLKQSTLIEAAKKGYQSVLSNGYYIDRLLSVAHHYSVDPIGDAKLTTIERAKILGGETTMWSELVTPLTIDSRIWPRTAAIAERYWSPREVNNIENMQKRLKVVSFQLEELGITHIKNKSVILRNLTKNQPITSLEILSNISEPIKVYSRNAGGTEYKSYSPFTLFADACTVDAKDAIIFNAIVKSYIAKPSKEKKGEIISFFKKWMNGYQEFLTLEKNPKLEKLALYYKEINTTSTLFLTALQNKTKSPNKALISSLKNLSKPTEDVELAIIKSLYDLYKSSH
jgi:hexosaminidase